MANPFPSKGKLFPHLRSAARGQARDLASFRTLYLAILAFVMLYVFTVNYVLEPIFDQYFRARVGVAAQVDPAKGSVSAQLQEQLDEAVRDSFWTRWGGVRINLLILGADGTLLYGSDGMHTQPPDAGDPEAVAAEAERVLPASLAHWSVTVPHNSLVSNTVLVAYASVMLVGLFFYNRALARREQEALAEAVAARDATASRAREIEDELARVRSRMSSLDQSENVHSREIEALRGERASLQEKIEALSLREQELMGEASQASELRSDHSALEELLEEAVTDLDQKNAEIQSLQNRLKSVSKEAASAASGRVKEEESLARRLRTLYKNLEVDDRAIKDLLKLRDESMQLRAEEALKRLSDDVETASVRRKVGGLPPGMPIFELGFAGKGRIYYTTGTQRRFRLLCVGAKNTQKPDLEYLSRLIKKG